VDTNSDPTHIDFPIPSNDDATKSITLITSIIAKAIIEGLEERKRDKEDEAEREAAAAKAKIDSGAAPETEESASGRSDDGEGGKRPRRNRVEAGAEEAESGE